MGGFVLAQAYARVMSGRKAFGWTTFTPRKRFTTVRQAGQ
jgi:hypothetical protein